MFWAEAGAHIKQGEQNIESAYTVDFVINYYKICCSYIIVLSTQCTFSVIYRQFSVFSCISLRLGPQMSHLLIYFKCFESWHNNFHKSTSETTKTKLLLKMELRNH